MRSWGVAYAVRLDANQGRPPYRWTVQGEPLPSGLTVDTVNVDGVEGLFVGGTASAEGLSAVLVSVRDAAGRYTELPFALRAVSPDPEPAEDPGCRCMDAHRSPPGSLLLIGAFVVLWCRRNLESEPKPSAFEVC